MGKLLDDLKINYDSPTETKLPSNYFKLLEEMDQESEALKKDLNEDQAKRVEKIISKLEFLADCDCDKSFRDGFRLGACLMAEAFCDG